MDHSDLSGSPIEPHAKAEVIIRLTDGRARRLTVTAAEADDLSGKGEPLVGLWRGMWAFVIRNWKSFAWWAFGLVVASLLLPAATKQWSDRQAALALKSSLISDISKSTISALLAGKNVVQATDKKEARKEWNKGLDAWDKQEASIDARLRAYFSDTDALDRWNRYSEVIRQYVVISCCTQKRADNVNDIKQYFEQHSIQLPNPQAASALDPWSILLSTADPAFGDAYDSLGHRLAEQRGALHNELQNTPASGYSSGFVDFWRDVIPGF